MICVTGMVIAGSCSVHNGTPSVTFHTNKVPCRSPDANSNGDGASRSTWSDIGHHAIAVTTALCSSSVWIKERLCVSTMAMEEWEAKAKRDEYDHAHTPRFSG